MILCAKIHGHYLMAVGAFHSKEGIRNKKTLGIFAIMTH